MLRSRNPRVSQGKKPSISHALFAGTIEAQVFIALNLWCFQLSELSDDLLKLYGKRFVVKDKFGEPPHEVR